jgi:alpha-tubulin suppressor-like RCC1 family protein
MTPRCYSLLAVGNCVVARRTISLNASYVSAAAGDLAADAHTLYVVVNQTVNAIDTQLGDVVWSTQLPVDAASTCFRPALSTSTLGPSYRYVACTPNHIFAVSPLGLIAWNLTVTSDTLLSSTHDRRASFTPVWNGGVIVATYNEVEWLVIAGSGALFAIQTANRSKVQFGSMESGIFAQDSVIANVQVTSRQPQSLQ